MKHLPSVAEGPGAFSYDRVIESARGEQTVGVEEVVRAVEPPGGTTEDETGNTFQSERKHEREEEPKEEL